MLFFYFFLAGSIFLIARKLTLQLCKSAYLEFFGTRCLIYLVINVTFLKDVELPFRGCVFFVFFSQLITVSFFGFDIFALQIDFLKMSRFLQFKED